MLRTVAQIVSWLSLLALTLPSVLFLAGRMELEKVKFYMIIATIVWFVSATLWMWNSEPKKQENSGKEQSSSA